MHSRPTAALTLLACALAACTAPAGAVVTARPVITGQPVVASPTDAVAAAPERTPDGECFEVLMTADGPPDTIERLSGYATRVVVAEVKSSGAGVWNTASGTRPANDRQSGKAGRPRILTPVTLLVSQTLVGPGKPGAAIQVSSEGGVDGCIVHRMTTDRELVQGDAYVFFLNDGIDFDGMPRPDRLRIVGAFPIDEQGTVTTDADGELPLAEFTSILRAAAAP